MKWDRHDDDINKKTNKNEITLALIFDEFWDLIRIGDDSAEKDQKLVLSIILMRGLAGKKQ